MTRLYELLRLVSSVLPSRFLRFLLRLWGQLSRRLGLSSSTYQHADSPRRPDSTTETTYTISASHVPASNAHISLADVPQATSSRYRPEIDIRDGARPRPRTQSTGTTFVTSPVPLSPDASPFMKGNYLTLPAIKPTTPSRSSRYNERAPVKMEACKIPAGPPVHRRQHRYLPPSWHKYMHPEGQGYFVSTSQHNFSIDVVTEAHMHYPTVREAVDDFSHSVLERAIDDGWNFDRTNIELLVNFDEEDRSCSYYFIDHENMVLFWLEEMDTGDFDDMPDASGPDHFRTYLQEMYWLHQEYFPSHRQEPPDREQDLIATLTHNCIDLITSTTSTSSFDRSQLETMLGVMKSLKNTAGSNGQRNCIIARLWNDICLSNKFALLFRLIYFRLGCFQDHTRFINFYGEKHARLFRTQMRPEEPPSSLILKIVFLLLFDAPSTHLTSLRELYVDNVLYSDGWRKFMEALVHDWQDLILWATVLLAANMSFLAIFNSTDDVVAENRAVTCSLVSTLSSTISVVIGLLHVRKHRPLARAHASDGNQYLEDATHPTLGLRPLAIVYSLPYAFLMWGMVTFIAAILLYAFSSGISLTSRYFVGAIAIGLGATLLWAVSYFWRDQVGFMEEIRRLHTALQSLSRWKRARTETPPETPNTGSCLMLTDTGAITTTPEKTFDKIQEEV